MRTFEQNVIEVVKKIPKGSVMTYAQVAKRAGNQNAARAVGTIMAKNDDKNVPCHRVVRADGSIGEYNSLQGKSKHELLKNEGVVIKENGKVLFI